MHADKCDTIRNELFQPPPQLEEDFSLNLNNEDPNDLEFQELMQTEIREAIFNASTNTAPGVSQIPNRVICWAWQVAGKYITALMRQCFQVGYHRREWQQAIAVALQKPRKPDYSNPRAYRLIQLLECLGKVLEKS